MDERDSFRPVVVVVNVLLVILNVTLLVILAIVFVIVFVIVATVVVVFVINRVSKGSMYMRKNFSITLHAMVT